MENCLLLFHYSGGGQFSLKEYNRKICPLILIQGNLSAFQWWTVFADEDKGKDENREICPQYTLSYGEPVNALIVLIWQVWPELISLWRSAFCHIIDPHQAIWFVYLRVFYVAADGQYIERDNMKF